MVISDTIFSFSISFVQLFSLLLHSACGNILLLHGTLDDKKNQMLIYFP